MSKIADTLTMSHLLDENLFENGLKYLTKKYLNREVTKYKDVIKYGTDSLEFYNYGMEDAINTYDLYNIFSPEITKQGLNHLFWDIEMPFQKTLMELEINGIKADVNAAAEMTYEIKHLYYQIENELLNIFGGTYIVSITPRSRVVSCVPSINFNSSDQVVPLIEGLGFEIFERSKKTKRKSWAKVAKARLKGCHPTIDLLIKLGKVEKLLNGFLIPFERFIDADGRIRCSFHNTVCVTGRLSCSKPNIEQLPKNNDIANIRNLFIADDDNVLIVADYSGQELRIMAEEAQDSVMLSELRKGFDIHLSTANDMEKLNLTLEQLTAGSDAFNIAKNKYKKQRDNCKCIGFGIPYGKGSYGFAKDFQTTQDEAQKIIDKWFTKYPAIKLAIERTRRQVSQHGYVKNMSGRKRRFPDFKKMSKWEKERCYRQAFNFKIQGFGADVVKKAASEIIKNPNVKLCNIVHDEIVCEVNNSYIEEGKAWINKCMVEALPMSIKWEVEISYANRYGEVK